VNDTWIIRVSGEGQYRIPRDENLLAELNTLDNKVAALIRESEAELQRLVGQMAALVREQGEPLEAALVESDLVLPPSDLTLCEAVELFEGEGIIPG
jgi:hypothetical protein